jgi:Mn2+/Fe2+ NRAMP family transporter
MAQKADHAGSLNYSQHYHRSCRWQEGLSKALNGTQVALSVILPFVSAPLIYFTCRNKFMTVAFVDDGEGEDSEAHEREQESR